MRHEQSFIAVRTPPIPVRDHSICCLAVSSLQSEQPRLRQDSIEALSGFPLTVAEPIALLSESNVRFGVKQPLAQSDQAALVTPSGRLRRLSTGYAGLGANAALRAAQFKISTKLQIQ